VSADIDRLQASLPEGERVLWQGRPCWKTMAIQAFQARKLAIYFAILLVWYALSSFNSAETARDAALATLRMTGVALVPLALVCTYAWITARMTTYTITDRRVIFGIGVALPMTINVPFSRVQTAATDVSDDGSGSIVLTLLPAERLAYLMMWPHARPWRMSKAEPMLRCIPDAAPVSKLLARALAASAGLPVRAAPAGIVASAATQPSVSAVA
jgi:hypothetical protein